MVVGTPDDEYGERVSAAIVLTDSASTSKSSDGEPALSITTLREDLRPHLPSYQLPTVLRVVKSIPKNATGKVMKKALRPVVFPPEGHAEVQRWERTRKDGTKL